MDLRALCCVVCSGLAAACASAPQSTPPPARTTMIRLSTGLQGGGFFPLGEEIAAAMHGKIAGVEIQSTASLGGIANLHAIQRHETDLAFTFADVAYMGFVG